VNDSHAALRRILSHEFAGQVNAPNNWARRLRLTHHHRDDACFVRLPHQTSGNPLVMRLMAALLCSLLPAYVFLRRSMVKVWS